MQIGPKLRKTTIGIAHYCPACKNLHIYNLDASRGSPAWSWNSSLDLPTCTPSMLVTYRDPDEENPDEICHYFLTNGQIQFCGDSTHKLKGQTVPLPDLPDEWKDEPVADG